MKKLLNEQQQIELLAGYPLANVLNEVQLRVLNWRGKVLGDVHPQTGVPTGYVWCVDKAGTLTYMFSVATALPQWYVHVYIHATSAHLNQYGKSRSKKSLHGAMICKAKGNQTEGLIADIHLVAENLSELTIVHEAVHAAGFLSRTIGVYDAKIAARDYTTSQSAITWREEIQCRSVEWITKEIVMTLQALKIPCIPLRDASLI